VNFTIVFKLSSSGHDDKEGFSEKQPPIRDGMSEVMSEVMSQMMSQMDSRMSQMSSQMGQMLSKIHLLEQICQRNGPNKSSII
jgi:uncharacterized protein YecA (UPF0149 family)